MATNDTRITVSRRIDAPASAIFNVLTLPQRHAEFDGSGMVRSDEKAERLQKVGDVFVMNMYADFQGGDYTMYNHVSAYDKNAMIGWKPAQEKSKDTPGGWEWLYTLNAVDSETTDVTLTYDWADVTDEELLPLFPLVKEDELEESLNRLAAVVADA
ncbi:MAG: SRPBCC family protein [Bowdeniella nasicola]|nr:SRPBCC family protein [Bowdeniella nasicola]